MFTNLKRKMAESAESTPKSPEPETSASSDRRVVQVTYEFEDEFLLPKGLDLEDKLQVKEWEVRFNILHITKADDTELKIESGGLIDSFRWDLKFPSTTTIIGSSESSCYNNEEEEDEEDEETSAQTSSPSRLPEVSEDGGETVFLSSCK
jgi:hypothetical protein